MRSRSRSGWIVGCLLVVAGSATLALADGSFPKIASQKLLDECSDCHLAYQPQMLPQRSWRKLMDGLADHFGEEVSVDDETRQEVLNYLVENAADAGTSKRGRKFMKGLGSDETPIRITEMPRWRKKHRELPERVWTDPRLEFKGQCEVCHTAAQRGRYDDDADLRVPGPNGSWRRWEDD